MSQLLPPLLVGSGVAILLFGTKSDLPTPAYFVNIPFWPLFVMPSGLLWKNKILKVVNQGQFPPQMRSYRELFLFNRKAIIYQLFFNQIWYHTFLGLSFIAYTYFARALYDKQTKRKPFLSVAKQIAFGFVKIRLFFITASLLTQFWGSKLNLKTNPDGKLHLSPNTIRILLIKETLLNVVWMGSVAKLVHDHYSIGIEGLREAH